MGNKEEAKKWKATTLAMPTKTLDDAEAEESVKKINV